MGLYTNTRARALALLKTPMTPNEIAVAKAKNEALKRPTQSERAKLAKLLLLTAVRGNPDKLVHTHNAKLAVKLADALLEELQ